MDLKTERAAPSLNTYIYWYIRSFPLIWNRVLWVWRTFVQETWACKDGDLMVIDCWFVSLWCHAVCPPSCVPQWTLCVFAAASSWFRFWSWFIVQQDTVWIRSTAWSSAAPPPPCLDTQSCCIAMELTNGLDLFCWSDIDLWLIRYWSVIDPLLILWLLLLLLTLHWASDISFSSSTKPLLICFGSFIDLLICLWLIIYWSHSPAVFSNFY